MTRGGREINDVVLKCIVQVRKTQRPPKDVKEAITLARAIAEKHADGLVRTRARRPTVRGGTMLG